MFLTLQKTPKNDRKIDKFKKIINFANDVNSNEFKKAYINDNEGDIKIINSPVEMPVRALNIV